MAKAKEREGERPTKGHRERERPASELWPVFIAHQVCVARRWSSWPSCGVLSCVHWSANGSAPPQPADTGGCRLLAVADRPTNNSWTPTEEGPPSTNQPTIHPAPVWGPLESAALDKSMPPICFLFAIQIAVWCMFQADMRQAHTNTLSGRYTKRRPHGAGPLNKTGASARHPG